MKPVAWMCAVTVLAAPVSAADPPGFALWRASDLKGHDAALSKHVGEDPRAFLTASSFRAGSTLLTFC